MSDVQLPVTEEDTVACLINLSTLIGKYVEI
jgi:hypothetical protein